MNVIEQLAVNLNDLRINDLFFQVLSTDAIQDWIISTVQTRLYELGTDKMNDKLKTDAARIFASHPYYSYYTVAVKHGNIKRKDGKGGGDSRTENVTLKDSGEFYDSMRVVVKKTLLQIQANFRKEDGHIQKNFELSYNSPAQFEDYILGLTDEETDLLIENFIQPRLIKLILKNSLQNV